MHRVLLHHSAPKSLLFKNTDLYGLYLFTPTEVAECDMRILFNITISTSEKRDAVNNKVINRCNDSEFNPYCETQPKFQLELYSMGFLLS